MTQTNSFDIPTDLKDLCDPVRTALLVYDMQVGIISQIKGAEAIGERCGAALDAARKAGMRVAFTRHLSCPNAWMGVTQYRTAMGWQRTDDPEAVKPWFLRGTPGFEIVPELRPTPDEMVFDKLAMSALEGTPLAYALKDRGILGVVIVGIATGIGIEPTARHATDLGFVPIFLADACGAGHPEAGERSMETLRFIGKPPSATLQPLPGHSPNRRHSVARQARRRGEAPTSREQRGRKPRRVSQAYFFALAFAKVSLRS